MTLSDMAYKLEGRAMRGLYRLLHARPSSRPFISGDSFRALAARRFEAGASFDPQSIKTGDLVFVEASQLDRFMAECLPAIENQFVLISHNGDRNIGPDLTPMAEDARVARWFAQNVGIRHPKLEPIPIGLENRHHHDKGITGDFRLLMRQAPTRSNRILYGFDENTNRKERGEALEALRASPVAEELGWVNGRKYRMRLSRYAFVASPPGNGIDCHRTWEALYLGVLPIVRRSPLFDSLEGFPGIAVEDWLELVSIDEAFLRRAFAEGSKRLAGFRPLWMPYWVERIEAARRMCS
jgi:hypothetical protein